MPLDMLHGLPAFREQALPLGLPHQPTLASSLVLEDNQSSPRLPLLQGLTDLDLYAYYLGHNHTDSG